MFRQEDLATAAPTTVPRWHIFLTLPPRTLRSRFGIHVQVPEGTQPSRSLYPGAGPQADSCLRRVLRCCIAGPAMKVEHKWQSAVVGLARGSVQKKCTNLSTNLNDMLDVRPRADPASPISVTLVFCPRQPLVFHADAAEAVVAQGKNSAGPAIKLCLAC